jgi:DNA-binding NtrC family response regulator
MGAFAYLTKPFQLDVVEDTVVRAIARRQELRTKPQEDRNNGESVAGEDAPAADAPERADSAEPS